MAYIDIDDVLRAVDKRIAQLQNDKIFMRKNRGAVVDLYGIKQFLHAIPAADVKPVVHGEWNVIARFEDCVYANCNKCGITQVFYHGKPLTNFCPNCGAYMK